jgi:hypothetical protein
MGHVHVATKVIRSPKKPTRNCRPKRRKRQRSNSVLPKRLQNVPPVRLMKLTILRANMARNH